MDPQRCPCSNSQKLWLCDVTWEERIKAADGIEVANQPTMGWKDYPGLFGWAQCSYKGPYN